MILEVLTPAEQLEVFGIAIDDYRSVAGEVLVGMEPSRMRQLLGLLEPERITAVLEEMPVDDAVHVVEHLPEELRESVLGSGELAASTELHNQLTYADDSAGRIMTTEYLALEQTTRAGEAISLIQEMSQVEMFFYLYVIGSEGELVGVVSLRRLLLTPPSRTLGDIMDASVLAVTTETDQEEVAQLSTRYNLLAVPVTDELGRLVGVVTIDDVIDVVHEEAEEDFFRMVGSSDDELLYREKSWKVARIRLPWLLINLVGLFLTGLLFKWFDSTLEEALFLVFFAPVIMGMGGNIGAQTSTIAVRSLATGRLTSGQGRVRAFLGQQARVGLLIGVAVAPIAAIGAILMERSPMLGVVVALSLFVAITLATLNGSVVPLLFERLGIDPAVAAGPMVTTSSDMIGIAVYFGFAALMIDLLV